MDNCVIEKPTVYYDRSFTPSLKIGRATVLYPINHPSPSVSNTSPVITSHVQKIGNNGVFETENTKYIPSSLKWS